MRTNDTAEQSSAVCTGVRIKRGQSERAKIPLDDGDGGEARILRVEPFFAGEQDAGFLSETETVLTVRGREDLELGARLGLIHMDDDVVGIVSDKELAAFSLGEIVVLLHGVTFPYRE